MRSELYGGYVLAILKHDTTVHSWFIERSTFITDTDLKAHLDTPKAHAKGKVN